jgi:hypothetical protein
MTDITETEADEVEATEAQGSGLTPRAAALDAERREVDSATDGELVEARTADTSATKVAAKVPDEQHVKVFVIPGDEPKPTASNYDHDPNIAATRQYMMSQGLRPMGDVVFKGAEPFGPGGKSWALTYAVPAVPAERFDFQAVGVLDQQEGEAPGDEGGDEAPTMDNTREQIDAYGAQLDPPIDTTGAATKADALALLGIKPSE